MNFQPATPVDEFNYAVSIAPHWIAVDKLSGCFHALTEEQCDWFYAHVDRRTRWKHANDGHWHFRLERSHEESADWYLDIVERWAEEFIASPDGYRRRYPHHLFAEVEEAAHAKQ